MTSDKICGSGVTSTLGPWYGGVVTGVLLFFNEAAILYRDVNSAPSQKQNIIVFAANNSRCCECHVAPTIIFFFTRSFFYFFNLKIELKGSDQRKNRRVWSNINTRYLVWGCGDGRSFIL